MVAFVMRLRLKQTTTRDSRESKAAGSVVVLLREHRSSFLTVLGFTAGGSLMFYMFTIYMQKYLVNTAGLSITAASTVMTACLFVYMCQQPLFGALSDRIGRRANMLLFSGLCTVATMPILFALGNVTGPIAAFFLITAAVVILSFYTSVSGIVKAEMFPTEIRALGVGLAYAIANAAFGGSAEYAALSAKQLGREPVFAWYVTAMMAIVFLASLRLPKGYYLQDDQ